MARYRTGSSRSGGLAALVLLIALVTAACGSGVSKVEYDDRTSGLAEAATQLASAGDELRLLTSERDLLLADVDALETERTDSEAIRLALTGLFADVNAALRESDGAALYDTLAAGVTELCTIEDLQLALEAEETSLLQAEVDRVFVDVDTPDRAFVQLTYTGEEIGELSEAMLSALLPLVHWPVVQEGDAWRLGLPFLEQLTGEVLPLVMEEFPFLVEDELPCPFALHSLAKDSGFGDGTQH